VICGGSEHGSFEAFCISTERYSPINFSIAPGAAIVVNAGNCLITYCEKGMVKWRFLAGGSSEVEILGIAPSGTARVETSTQPFRCNRGTFYAYKGEFYQITENRANRQRA
jgi:hypothetical protein